MIQPKVSLTCINSLPQPRHNLRPRLNDIFVALWLDSAHFTINQLITRVRSECMCICMWERAYRTAECTRVVQGGKMAVLTLCVLAWLALLVSGEVDECQVYYGGLIFPEGSRRSPEHGLHWSKTQSTERERSCLYGDL